MTIAAMTLGTISARLAAATPYANQRPNPMSRTRRYEIETPRELCWSTIAYLKHRAERHRNGPGGGGERERGFHILSFEVGSTPVGFALSDEVPRAREWRSSYSVLSTRPPELPLLDPQGARQYADADLDQDGEWAVGDLSRLERD